MLLAPFERASPRFVREDGSSRRYLIRAAWFHPARGQLLVAALRELRPRGSFSTRYPLVPTTLKLASSNMQVTIRRIDPSRSSTIPGTTRLGYPVEFASRAASGSAVLVLAPGAAHRLREGATIDVDPRHESVRRFERLSRETPPVLRPTGIPGSYEVRGRVAYRHPNGNFGVDAGGVVLSLHEKEIGTRAPDAGEHVAFEIEGLSLWLKGA